LFYSRWIAVGIFVALIVVIIYFDRDKNLKRKAKNYGMMFVEGMAGGFIIDCIGISAGYYYFPRQPFLSIEYFAIVIPCWGVFGLLLNTMWNLLGKDKFWQGMAVTLVPLFAFYEGTNLLTQSWVYTTPFYIVALGWIPLVWTFAGCNRRRRVVFKIEEWKLNFVEQKISHQLVYGMLTLARVVLTIAMFPLMIAVIIRLCVEIPTLIKRDISIWAYTKTLVAME